MPRPAAHAAPATGRGHRRGKPRTEQERAQGERAPVASTDQQQREQAVWRNARRRSTEICGTDCRTCGTRKRAGSRAGSRASRSESPGGAFRARLGVRARARSLRSSQPTPRATSGQPEAQLAASTRPRSATHPPRKRERPSRTRRHRSPRVRSRAGDLAERPRPIACERPPPARR